MADAAGWDCHAHLFGPYARYPLAENPSYTPPPALEAQYLALLDRLNLSHGVLVQPSAYDRDHSLLFDVLAARPQWRGVVVARTGTFTSFAGLRARGVRAARFSHRSGSVNFAGSASFDELLHSAGALADAGMHAELWTDCRALPAIAGRLETLPVPVVIDHMGGFNVEAGVDEPGFRRLLALLESGRVWVKLCAYRNLPATVSMDAGRPFHRALLEANPSNLVWGSDWPHLRMNPPPDAADLLERFRHWTGDAALIERVLADNPARLYA
jgi:predicted TIM-barrel fold metal-dependent hydrolase